VTWIWLLLKSECQSMGMDGREERSLGKLSCAGRVLTFILLGWVSFYYQQLMQISCIKSDLKHDVWCLQWQNTGGWVLQFWCIVSEIHISMQK